VITEGDIQNGILITCGFAATGSPLRPDEIEPLYEKFVAYYGANIARGSAPFPGCVALLDQLKAKNVLLGICTNKLEGLSVRLIEALGLTSYFAAIIGPDTIGIAKPDPAPYREACAAWAPRRRARSSSAIARRTC
jgi:phosphoglycolate phosphatase